MFEDRNFILKILTTSINHIPWHLNLKAEKAWLIFNDEVEAVSVYEYLIDSNYRESDIKIGYETNTKKPVIILSLIFDLNLKFAQSYQDYLKNRKSDAEYNFRFFPESTNIDALSNAASLIASSEEVNLLKKMFFSAYKLKQVYDCFCAQTNWSNNLDVINSAVDALVTLDSNVNFNEYNTELIYLKIKVPMFTYYDEDDLNSNSDTDDEESIQQQYEHDLINKESDLVTSLSVETKYAYVLTSLNNLYFVDNVEKKRTKVVVSEKVSLDIKKFWLDNALIHYYDQFRTKITTDQIQYIFEKTGMGPKNDPFINVGAKLICLLDLRKSIYSLLNEKFTFFMTKKQKNALIWLEQKIEKFVLNYHDEIINGIKKDLSFPPYNRFKCDNDNYKELFKQRTEFSFICG